MNTLVKALRPFLFDGRIMEAGTVFEAPRHLAEEYMKYKLCESVEPVEPVVVKQSVEEVQTVPEVVQAEEVPTEEAPKKKRASRKKEAK